MKTHISFKRIIIATSAAAALMFISLPFIVGATPTATPTGGNVDANFNTVRSSLYYDANNTAYYIDPASTSYTYRVYGYYPYFYAYYDRNNSSYYLDPASTGTALSIAGGINNPSANPVLFNDAQGIEITGVGNLNLFDNVYSWDGAGPIYFQSGDGVNFSNPFTGINHFRINGSGYLSNDAGAVTINDAAVITGVISNGGAGSLDINDGVDISGNISNDAGGAVTIYDLDGLNINRGDLTFSGSSSASIENTYGSDPVRVDDRHGLVVNAHNGSTWSGLNVDTDDGGILVTGNNVGVGVTPSGSGRGGFVVTTNSQGAPPSAGGLTINANYGSNNWGGLVINSDYGGIELNTPYGGIVNSYAGRSVKIADSLDVTSSIDGNSHLFLSGTAYIDSNLDVDGGSNLKGNIYNSSSNYSGRVYVNDNFEVNGSLYADYSYPTYLYPGSISTSGSVTTGNLYPSYINTSGGSIYGGYIKASSGMYSSGSSYGIMGYGSTAGGYFNDNTNSGYAHVGYGDRGIWGRGNFAGGTFSDLDNGTWVDAAQGSYSIRGNGMVSGTSWQTYSDRKLKKNIEDYLSGLDEILLLRPIKFKYTDKNALALDNNVEHVGLIAQEVQKIIPEAVNIDESGYLALEPDIIFTTMINAIQELKVEKDDEIAELKAEIEELKEIVCELKPEAVSCK